MSECFKVPSYKAILLSCTICVKVLSLVRRQAATTVPGWLAPKGYEDDNALLSLTDVNADIDATDQLTQPDTTTIYH